MSEQLKDQVAGLWRLCFDDTDEFVRLYFDTKYRSEYTLVYREGSKVLAAVQLLPYDMKCFGSVLKTAYISGASTHPDFRNRGLMGILLKQSFEKMKKEGISFSILIPQELWLTDYYRRFGYSTIFGTSANHYLLDSEIRSLSSYVLTQHDCEIQLKRLFVYFSLKTADRRCAILHDYVGFEVILKDLYLSGGRLFIASDDDGEITGMAFGYLDETRVLIREILSDDVATEKELLQSAVAYWHVPEVTCIRPPLSVGSIPAGMLRIIDAENVLSRFAANYPDKSLSFRLSDTLLPANNGYYVLKDGICSKMVDEEGASGRLYDIGEFAQVLFGYGPEPANGFLPQNAYMSLMLD